MNELLFVFQAVERVKTKCKKLSEVQRRNLAISSDDIVFVLPEDVSVLFDGRGTALTITFAYFMCQQVCQLISHQWLLRPLIQYQYS